MTDISHILGKNLTIASDARSSEMIEGSEHFEKLEEYTGKATRLTADRGITYFVISKLKYSTIHNTIEIEVSGVHNPPDDNLD